MDKPSIHGMWSSRMAFILAATGAAVGLGNIWRFPYLASDNGGGAFVLIYLACIALVGLPLMLTEIALGRAGRLSPINTFIKLAREGNLHGGWVVIGWMGLVAAILILSFYSVIAGWTLYYGWLYIQQVFGGPGIDDPTATFNAMLANPKLLLFWHTVFMVLTVGVVASGVEKGLERAVTLLMPTLLVLLLMLLGYGFYTGFVGQAAEFLFKPDFSEVTGQTFVRALGQAFFSLSLGMCGIMTYGAYLPERINIAKVGITVAAADTGVALLAGLAIFPIVFQFGLDPAGGGPGLIFTSLPLAFADMGIGIYYGVAFFLLLAVAAWTSSISLLEPGVAYVVEKTKKTRRTAAILVGTLIWAVGLLTVFTYNVLAQVRIMGRDVEGAIEYLANDLMLPLGGMLMALYAGWALDKRVSREQLDGLPDWAYAVWRVLMRYVTPALVAVILINVVI